MFNFFGGKRPSMTSAVEECQRDPAIKLVDVRTPGEYSQGHLPGSLLLPLDQLSRAPSVLPDKNATLYVYCLSGSRSALACQLLARMGYSHATNIGGIGGYSGALER